MSQDDILSPLLVVIRDLLSWLQSKDVPGIIIGGVAASLLGRPRLTRDIDALVLLDSKVWADFLNAGIKFGFVSRLPDSLQFAEKARVLLVRHEHSGIDVDISFGALPFEEEAIRHAVMVEVGGIEIPLPTPEDLVIMKAIAHRSRDLSDIESILDATPELDIKRILQLVTEFSDVLEMPEILSDLKRILRK